MLVADSLSFAAEDRSDDRMPYSRGGRSALRLLDLAIERFAVEGTARG